MNFSEEWKSLWPVASVLSPPLLLSGPAAKPLGPLLFTPSPETLNLLCSSSSLSPSIPPPCGVSLRESLQTVAQPSKDTFIPPSVTSSIAAELGSQSDDTAPIVNNNLQMLRCPNGDIAIFFPTGENSDRIGFVVLSSKELSWKVMLGKEGQVFTTPNGFNHRILKMGVTSFTSSGWDLSSSSGNYVPIGFLLACTLYSVHWFRIQINSKVSNSERPVLVYLGMKMFSSSVVHACWSSHLPGESMVLLENGGLFMFDLGACSGSHNFLQKFEGTRVKVSWKGSGMDLDSSEKGGWLSFDFAWHPRILIVASSKTVLIVDWRYGESHVHILARIGTSDLNQSKGTDRYVAFSMAGLDGFYFTVATEHWLLLFDIRKPLIPVLQWAHGLDKPRYVNVLGLSELRSPSKEDTYTWASESGFAILLGSFWNCEFSIFCYGPSLPAPDGSVASKVSKLCNSLYAWELPSEISLSGRQCHCGDCLVREDFSKATLPVWMDWRQKKEIVLGFCVIGKDFSSPLPETNNLGGFTLIRLMSSGKLESQMYYASWDFISAKSEEGREKGSLQLGDCLLYPSGDQKYKFPKRFKYLKLDYLLGYLRGDLTKVVVTRMQNPQIGSTDGIPCTQDCRELICDKLKAVGFDQNGSSIAVADVFNDISLPTSIHEIALRRLWAGLPVDLLQLAFTNYSRHIEVLIDQKKVSLAFLDVSNLPQLPPFFLRKPSKPSDKSSHKVQPGDSLVGPVLPLPVLLTLHEIDKDKSFSDLEEAANGYSAESELTHQCNEIMKVANDMASPYSFSEVDDNHVVSLANDRDEKWVSSQEPKPFLSYIPQAFSDKSSPTTHSVGEQPVFEDKRLTTFITKKHEFASNPNKDSKIHEEFAPNSKKDQVGLEMFDDLCPVELKFDASPMSFGMKELKEYKLLKRQFSKWQEGFKPYQDFCNLSKVRKQVP